MADGSVSADHRTLHHLILAGLAYNVVEGILCVGSGLLAGSITLVGFGLDSGIEAAAATAALRYLRGAGAERAEENLSGFVGWTFLALAGYVMVQSVHDLTTAHDVDPSALGLAVTALSLLVMPALGIWKLRLARKVGSRGLEAEAKETIACSYLSLFAVAGVAVRFGGGPSWIDPAAALCMVPWLLREGVENLRPEAEET